MEEKSIKTLLLEKQKQETEIRQQPEQVQVQKVNISELKEKVMKNRSPSEDYENIEPSFEVKRETSVWNKNFEPRQRKIAEKDEINFFGGKNQTYMPKESEITAKNTQTQAINSEKKTTSAVETPNYDFIEPLNEKQEKKIFKIEHSEKKKAASPLLKRLKIIAFALIFGVLGAWTIYNGVNLSQISNEYNLKLEQYLFKLGTLDSASGANDLFPTYPEEENSASSVAPKSNWFDRLCNFIAGIFGG